MEVYRIGKQDIIFVILAAVMALTSCSSDYRNVIPVGSTAIMSVDVSELLASDNNADVSRVETLTKLLCIYDVEHCGIDLWKKIYVFEAADGAIGLVAKVNDEDAIDEWTKRLIGIGRCSGITEKKGYKFTMLNGVFIVGYSSDALLIMGPVIGNDRARTQKKMIKYLEAKSGIMDTDLYGKLDAMEGTVSVVAQANSLPDRIAAPIMSLAPQKINTKDVIISASFMLLDDGWLNISCEISSENKSINDVLISSSSCKQFSNKYIGCIDEKAEISVLCGMEGENMIARLRENETLRTTLVGLNTIIDIDKMLKSIDGDMFFSIPSSYGGKLDFQLIADTKNCDWLDDVDYWKETIPQGTFITNRVSGGYCLSNSDLSLYFGMNDKQVMYIGTTERLSENTWHSSDNPLPDNIKTIASGKRLFAIVNLNSFFESRMESKAISSMMSPILGNVRMVVFSIK